jgi:hypothetical protein
MALLSRFSVADGDARDGDARRGDGSPGRVDSAILQAPTSSVSYSPAQALLGLSASEAVQFIYLGWTRALEAH